MGSATSRPAGAYSVSVTACTGLDTLCLLSLSNTIHDSSTMQQLQLFLVRDEAFIPTANAFDHRVQNAKTVVKTQF